jgi:hypothetical protein
MVFRGIVSTNPRDVEMPGICAWLLDLLRSAHDSSEDGGRPALSFVGNAQGALYRPIAW